MHGYFITKHITPTNPNPFRGVVNFLILVIAIPVVAISIVSIFIYFFFTWFLSFFVKGKTVEPVEEHYHSELELLNNEYAKILLVEDELDTELSHLNELWMDNVYNRETCLYRAKTIPLIEELEGRVVCFYVKEQTRGAILQVLNRPDTIGNPIDSQLVYLNYPDLEVSLIDQTGSYYLHNDEKNANLILGFNKKENIRIELLGA